MPAQPPSSPVCPAAAYGAADSAAHGEAPGAEGVEWPWGLGAASAAQHSLGQHSAAQYGRGPSPTLDHALHTAMLLMFQDEGLVDVGSV